jgi:serine/threonine protein kinase
MTPAHGEPMYEQEQEVIVFEENHVLKKSTLDGFPCIIREITALQLLNKAKVPHCVHLQDVKEDGTLVLDKFDGDLCDMTDTALVTEKQIIHSIYRILTVLANMQDLNLSHRDIKPENVLIDRSGETIAVCDFGLSRYYSGGNIPEQSTFTVQTTYYRCPEMMFDQLKHEPGSGYSPHCVNPRNMDIWSLGITALKLFKLNDFLPPRIIENELTLQEFYDIYVDTYGNSGRLKQYQGHPCPPVLQLIKDMLTMNPESRPGPHELLQRSVFDDFRGPDLIDAKRFNQQRVQLLLQRIPEVETDPLIIDMLIELSHYQFNNAESMKLAACMIYMLSREDLHTVELETIVAVAASIFDTDIIAVAPTEATDLLKKLDYDIMFPVTDHDVSQRLDRLLSTV